MDHTDDLHVRAHYAVEDEIVPMNKISKPLTNIVTGRAQMGMLGKQAALVVQCVQQTVRSRGIICGHVAPDVDKVLAGTPGADETGHALRGRWRAALPP